MNIYHRVLINTKCLWVKSSSVVLSLIKTWDRTSRVLSRGFCAGQQSLPCGETPETRSHAHFSFPKLREKKHVMLSAERLRHRGDKILQRHVFMQQNQVDDPFMDDICGDERTASNPQVEEKVQLTKHETGLKYVKLLHIVCTQMEHLISM